MKYFLIFLSIFFISAVLLSQNSYGETTVYSESVTLSNLLINFGDTHSIQPGVELIITGDLTNEGTLLNFGTIDNTGEISNIGHIQNFESISSGNNISNSGIIYNYGTITVQGSITNQSCDSFFLDYGQTTSNEIIDVCQSGESFFTEDTTLENFQISVGQAFEVAEGVTLTITGTVDVYGYLQNRGTIQNNGIINIIGDGDFDSGIGQLVNLGYFENHGDIHLTTSGILLNYDTFVNFANIENEAYVISKTLSSYFENRGTINTSHRFTVAYGGTIDNFNFISNENLLRTLLEGAVFNNRNDGIVENYDRFYGDINNEGLITNFCDADFDPSDIISGNPAQNNDDPAICDVVSEDTSGSDIIIEDEEEQSQETEQETHTTQPQVPSAPLNLAADQITPWMISLNWDDPASDGGSILTGYIIIRNVHTGSSVTSSEINHPHLFTAYSDSTVSSDLEYSYRVKAVNAIGIGPHSNIASPTGAGIGENLSTGVEIFSDELQPSEVAIAYNIAAMNTVDIKDIPVSQIKLITVEVLDILPAEKVQAFTPKQFAALPDETIKNLNPELMSKFSKNIIIDFPETKEKILPEKIIKTFSPKVLQEKSKMKTSMKQQGALGEQITIDFEVKAFIPPLQQLKIGIPPEEVACNDDLILIKRISDGAPACVTPSSFEKLITMGLARTWN